MYFSYIHYCNPLNIKAMGMIKYYDYEDGELFIFDEFVINQVKEGVIIEPAHNDLLNEVIQENFSGETMVYISNRVKSYSVNPMVYSEAEKIPNLIAIALIPKTNVMRRSAEFERQFYDKPYEIFNSLSRAIIWAHEILQKNNILNQNIKSEKRLKF